MTSRSTRFSREYCVIQMVLNFLVALVALVITIPGTCSPVVVIRTVAAPAAVVS